MLPTDIPARSATATTVSASDKRCAATAGFARLAGVRDLDLMVGVPR
jgi:hypothetical protein